LSFNTRSILKIPKEIKMALKYLKYVLFVAVVAVVGLVLAQSHSTKSSGAVCDPNKASACGVSSERTIDMTYPIMKTDEEWRKELTPEQYKIIREGDTEAPFTGKYYHFKHKGVYLCAACGQELFSSDTKYNSGSGWPSFWAPMADKDIKELPDHSHGMTRTEVVCSRCGAHLGHVFEDGPKPTGLRFCINSASLTFEKQASEQASK
jgi:peptide-methionine (R)-S-oxide reductase